MARPGWLRDPREDRRVALGLGAGLVVVLALVVLLATGTIGGSGSGGGKGGGHGGQKATGAILRPVDGSDASGVALFARVNNEPVIVVRAKGLHPTPSGKAYLVSLSKPPSEKLPLIPAQVNKRGEIFGTIPIKPKILAIVAAGFDEMELSILSAQELNTALETARRAQKIPNYTGEPVLRGRITGPVAEAGERGAGNPRR